MNGFLVSSVAAAIDPSVKDYVALGVAAGAAVIALLLIWRVLPKYVNRLLKWIDDLIPADLSEFTRVADGIIVLLLAAIVVASAGLSIANSLGADVSRATEALGDFGKDVFNTAGPKFLRVLLIAFFAWVAIRAVRQLVPPFISRLITFRSDAATQGDEVGKRTRTLEGVISGTANVTIFTVASLMILTEIGVNVAPILAGAGIVGLAVGFGAQTLIRDIISGIFIMLEDQYRVGDVVRVAGTAGLVEDINLRRTTLRDLDFIMHVIPNGEIRTASNFTKEKSRVNLDIEVAYRTDLDHAITVLNRVGKELAEDEYFGPLFTEPMQVLRVNEFGASGIAIKVLGQTKPIRQWEVAGEFRKRIKKAFDEEGIEIPFPHQTIYWGEGEETRIRQVIDRGKEKASTGKTGKTKTKKRAKSRRTVDKAESSESEGGDGL